MTSLVSMFDAAIWAKSVYVKVVIVNGKRKNMIIRVIFTQCSI